MAFKEFVATIGTILTIFQFMSGSLICRKIVQDGGTGSVSAMPFICGIFSAG